MANKKVTDPTILKVVDLLEHELSVLLRIYRNSDYDADCRYPNVKTGMEYAIDLIEKEYGEVQND